MKKKYDLPDKTVELIRTVMKDKDFKTEVDTVIYMIESFAAERTVEAAVSDAVYERFEKLFTRVRLAARTAEHNSIILKDAVNTILYTMNDVGELIPAKEELAHPVIRDSEKMLKSDIARYKEIRDNKVFDEEK